MSKSPGEVRIVKEALLDEAAKWSALSADMSTVRHAIDGLALQVTAFFAGNPAIAQAAKKSYDGVWQLMSKLAGEASVEFNQINEALRRAHDEYEAADNRAAYDLRRIYGP